MKEPLTTYRAQGKTNGLTFLFKYDLNGFWKATEMVEGVFTEPDVIAAFGRLHPYTETDFIERWLKDEKRGVQFEITKSPPDLSFDALWELFDYKVSKADAIKSFGKLKEAEVIKCFMMVPKYLDWLRRNPGIGKLHLSTYINKRRFDDELPEAAKPYQKEKVGKVYNPALQDLAKKKTEK